MNQTSRNAGIRTVKDINGASEQTGEYSQDTEEDWKEDELVGVGA